ncbi:MAG TPA: hypothetical protein VE090_00085 [Methylomirabilota bacterium]|nr:hypothetical protein [Methylomirabilota bacterium]
MTSIEFRYREVPLAKAWKYGRAANRIPPVEAFLEKNEGEKYVAYSNGRAKERTVKDGHVLVKLVGTEQQLLFLSHEVRKITRNEDRGFGGI